MRKRDVGHRNNVYDFFGEQTHSNDRILIDEKIVLYVFKLHQFYFPLRSEMDEEIDDYEISMLMRQMFNRDEINNNERMENQLGENSGNEADDEDGEFVVSLNNQVNY